MTDPTVLSRELREGDSPDMTRRRWIIGLSLLGVAMGQIVSLYQTGILKNLPDPPIDIFDSNKVDASDYAYKRFDTPDGLIMTGSYALTATLASAGRLNRADGQPLIPLLMGLKALADVGINMQLAAEEWQLNKKLCFYCQTANVLSIIILALSIPETLRALGRLRQE